MRIADFTTPLARLQDAYEQLEATWLRVREDWDDSVSDRIEEEAMQPLRSQVRNAHEAAAKLAAIAGQAQRACENPREFE